MKCECEHEEHFPESERMSKPPEPFNSLHPYGQEVIRGAPIKTAYGTFNMCAECIFLSHGKGEDED